MAPIIILITIRRLHDSNIGGEYYLIEIIGLECGLYLALTEG